MTCSLRPLLILALVGCNQPMDTPADDGGMPVPDAGSSADAGPPFDPSMSYPGEGDPCEFSLFCGELQICVDGECQRHERFDADDLEVGEPRPIPHELLTTSSFYTSGPFNPDDALTAGALLGTMVPGPNGPTLILFPYSRRGECPIVIYGAGPPRLLLVPGIRCTAVGLSPDGHVLAAGINATDKYIEARMMAILINPDGDIVSEVYYPPEMAERVTEAIGSPSSRPFNMTSILWDEGRFLFSASAGEPDEASVTPGYSIPERPSHVFFGEVTLEGEVTLRTVAERDAQEGSYGWLVRDDSGVRSILTTYGVPDGLGGVSVDVLSWASGERTTLLSSDDGRGSAGRYFQPTPDRWSFSAIDYPQMCTAELYDGVSRAGSIADRWAPELCDESLVDLSEPSGTGGSSYFGPAFTGHARFEWLSIVLTHFPGTPDYQPVIHASSVGPWHVVVPPSGSRSGLGASLHAVSRFSKSVELFSASGGNVLAFEAPLSMGSR